MNATERFEQFLQHLAGGTGHADRHAGLNGYCTGLMLPLSRKSVEPMAASVDPLHASTRHQALLAAGAPRHCVLANAGYGVEAAFRLRLTELGLPYMVGIKSSVSVWLRDWNRCRRSPTVDTAARRWHLALTHAANPSR